MNEKMKKAFPYIIMGIILVCGCIFFGIQYYKHEEFSTRATVEISCTRESDTSDAYYEHRECKKGDQITIGQLTIVVTHIKKNGTLTFSVWYGELMNGSGEVIQSDELKMNEKKNYRSANDRFSLSVVAMEK